MGNSWESFCGSNFTDNPFATGLPNLSICMQHTILVWIPAAFSLLLTPALMVQGKRQSRRYESLPWSPVLIFKIILTLSLTGISIFFLVHNVIKSNYAADYLYPALLICSHAAMTFGHLVRKRCGLVTSGIQHLSVVIFLVAGAPEFYQRVRQGTDSDQDGRYLSFAMNIAYYVYYSVLVIYAFVLCFADPRSRDEKYLTSLKNTSGHTYGACQNGEMKAPFLSNVAKSRSHLVTNRFDKQQRSPELDSSFINRLTLWWFNPIPWIGSRKDLEVDDLFELNEASTTPYLAKLWDKHWTPRLRKYHQDKKDWKHTADSKEVPLPSVVGTLFAMFKYEFMTATFLKMCSDTLQFANPFLLHQMIDFVSDVNSPFYVGLSYAILMFVASEIRSFLINSYFYIMFRMGVKFQTTLTAAVYRKTLALSNSARRDKTVGEIVNLMAIDVERFQMITPQIQQFWSCPYQITLALIYLYITLGYSAAPGIVIMIIFLPLNIVASYIVKNWQTEQMKLKDERTKMVNEVLNGMKVVKLYAWEIPMEQYIDNIRQKELQLIKKSAMIRNVTDAFNTASPFLVALFSFTVYVLSSDEHRLTPQVAFVALTLFNQLRSPMTLIAYLINQAVQAVVSNKRMKSFFVAEELDMSIVERNHPDRSQISAEMEQFDATWDDTDPKQTLSEISLKVPRGDLLAVVGKVGSGKSSLLSALLGEMGKLQGRIGVNGKLAYVPQQAWIQNMTVKDNILFGKPYHKQLYHKVLYACALVSDLKILPHGDQTEIGEKGINLSGGQKARISLARAVYQNYDVYLLDDPLSAVDAHVGKHIFEKVIGPNGLLRSKTRILVTHGLTYVKHADEIVVLEDGRIAENGKYTDLLKQRGRFYQFLEEYKMKGSDSSDADSEESDTSSLESKEETERGYKENGEIGDIETTFKEKEKDFHAFVSQSKSVEEAQKLIKKEFVESGGVKLAVYKMYIRAASYWRSFFFVFFLVAFMSLQMGRSFWLSSWSNEFDTNKTSAEINNGLHLGVYAAIGTVESSSFLCCLIVMVYGGLNASTNLHFPLIHNLLRSPMAFFDTTPLGRILNRCAKDVEVIDQLLPINFRYLVMCLLQVFFTLIAIIIATPLFAVVIIPLAIIYYFFLRFYVPTSRQLKRLESINRSPIYSHFGETVQGAASIRAFDKVEDFQTASGKIVDRFIRCKYLNIVSNRWLAVRLEFIGNCVIFFAALFAVLSKEFGWSDNPGKVGVSISYALNITEVLNFAVRQISEIEANIVAVERLEEYTVTPNEAAWDIPETKPKSGWPSAGVVNFKKYSTRYRAGLDLVLQEISANVSSGEKIGIVGRTGAGKSSFALALFRLIEPAEGEIIIDGVDVSKIGLHDLRSALTIIPQDPVLFSGTLRFNLDPFEKCSDQEIWHALELAHLKEMASSFEKGLSHHISEGGENISVGQRQLVCLARALLRRTRILVLDEATAAVDVATDALIQTTIREQFKDCTVFTIAHRLNTILDYDRIMVLDKGQIAEFDNPDTLLEDKNTIFSRMVADSKNEESS